MTTPNPKFSSLSFNLGTKHITGKEVVNGVALGLSVTALYGFRKYLEGGWCHIDKSLQGKNVVITGGNGGIGKETARRLVQLGAFVIIGARDQKKNQQTQKQLQALQKGEAVAYHLDLASRTSIQQFVIDVKRELNGQPLHYLVNNAGIMALPERKLTEEGLQMQIGVNHFGHFYLTYLLWDDLKKAGNPRIVNVSALAHKSLTKNFDLDFDNLYFEKGGYSPVAAYSRSKKANILFAKQLQRRMTQVGLPGISVSLHPGVIRTDLNRNVISSWPLKILHSLLYPLNLYLMKNAVQGAQTTLYCILEDDDKMVKGGYYSDCRLKGTSSGQVEDQFLAGRLWLKSEKIFGVRFFM